MSRQNRRRAQSPAAAPAVAPPTMVGTLDQPRSISWRHCALGVLFGEVTLLLLSNLALHGADAAFGPSASADGGIVGVSTLIAVMVGGFIAAKGAGRFGLYQGVVVGIGFIVVGALYEFSTEAGIVHQSLIAAAGSGRRSLIDLGPMDMGSIISGDLLALFGGSVGGLFSGHR